jgi:hypothetical protein
MGEKEDKAGASFYIFTTLFSNYPLVLHVAWLEARGISEKVTSRKEEQNNKTTKH